MKTIKLFTALSACALLVACSATPEECDPNVEQSIWGKMACVNSGSYDTRVHRKESELSQEQAKNADLQGYEGTAQIQFDVESVSSSLGEEAGVSVYLAFFIRALGAFS